MSEKMKNQVSIVLVQQAFVWTDQQNVVNTSKLIFVAEGGDDDDEESIGSFGILTLHLRSSCF